MPLGNVVEIRGLVKGTTAADVEVRVFCVFEKETEIEVSFWLV